MHRRSLLKNFGFSIAGLMALPSWAEAWNQSNFQANINFSATENDLLAEIVETILPETTTPGAKSLGVHKLIQKLITDCQGPLAEAKMKVNLLKFNNLSKSNFGSDFTLLANDKKLLFFKSLEKSEDADMKSLYNQMKRMTIDGYMKSEYVMTNITNYEYAPARWNACVKVAQ